MDPKGGDSRGAKRRSHEGDVDATDGNLRVLNTRASALAAPEASVTVWVKRMDVPGARYVALKDVDLQQSVDDFTARWMAQAKLDVDPSLVTLRLVGCGARKPTAAEEEEAAVKQDADSRLSLADAGVINEASVLADIKGAVSTTVGVLAQHAPDALEAFWQQLPNATVEGNMFRLASGTTLLGSDLPNSSSMYIRSDYVGLWSEVQHLFSTDLRKIVISGNPGIGKSLFGLFVAYKLLTENKSATIVWEGLLSGARTLISNGRVLRGSLQDFRSELNDKKTWYLVDESVSPGPWHVAARTLVFSSPKHSNYHLFLKAPGSTIRYLPVWSWEEIDACRMLLYAGDPVRTPDGVAKAYARWGGIPRFVLEKMGDTSAQSKLEEAIANCDLRTLVQSIGAIDAAPDSDASHRILHIMASRSTSYVKSSVVLGSDYITSRIAERLTIYQRTELTSFVSREFDPLFANLRGVFFEALAHEKLAAGGDFRTRGLVPPTGESNLKLKPMQVQRFPGNKPADLADLPTASEIYLQPLVRNYPVLDAMIRPNMLLQMTVSPMHDVNESKLVEIKSIMKVDQIELVFVLPPEKFEKFTAYGFKDANLGRCIIQKALRVPFDLVV